MESIGEYLKKRKGVKGYNIAGNSHYHSNMHPISASLGKR